MQTAFARRALHLVTFLGLSLLAGGLVGPGQRAAEPATPMTDEDVVRLYVSGVGPESIIERIRAAEVTFDISEEMLEELRAAGLPEELIQAMVERQRALDAERAPPEETEETDSPPAPRLSVRLNPDWEPRDEQERPFLCILDTIDQQTYKALRLREEAPRFTDAALVLACLTADHVPDHWRGKTPLGRDFVSAPRHKLLAFLPGATRRAVGEVRGLAMNLASLPGEREGRPEPGLLELELPAAIDVEIEPGLVHDLILGLALQTEERYYLIRADTWEGFVLPEEGASIEAEIKGKACGDLATVEVRFKRPPPPGR
jgi:hypothetical protein